MKMHEMVMQAAETASTRKYTERVVKIIESTYSKANLDKVSKSSVQPKYEHNKELLGTINEFENLFGGTLGKWDTKPVDIEINTIHKPFNGRY